MTIKRFTALLLIALMLIFAVSCASTPTEVPEDITAEQLIQLAQESYDDGNTDAAVFYYETMLIRFGTADYQIYITAQYEIAHLLVKQGKTAEAERRLHDLLLLYQDEEQARLLPADYRKLAENELNRINAAK